jgi:hypothetical protein
MDAGEIWAWRDIQRGRWLTIFLFVAIIAKETAIIAGLVKGFVAAGTTLPPRTLAFIAPEALRVAFAFGLSLVFMILAYSGRSWARLCLGLNYLLLSGWAAYNLLRAADALQANASKIALGNAMVGLAIGLALIFLKPLRAFAWYQASHRPAIPVPMDDQPARRTMRRKLTLSETLASLLRRVATIVMVLIGLGILALFYGFGGTILQWLGR